MSRCFPFPPPGYEKKPQSDHVDILIKKHKEKKHKKEKRDKEKREGKERKDRDKDKDRSKDKHGEKKDKKEKHRDRDKKKEKKRDKDEKRTSRERKDGEHIEGRDDRKAGEDSQQTKDLKDATRFQCMGSLAQKETSTVSDILHSTTIPDQKRMVTIRDEQRGAVDQMVQRRFEEMGSSAQKERSMGDETLHSITIPEQKRMVTIRDEQRGAVDQMVQRRFEGMDSSAKKARTTGNEILHSVTIPEQKRTVRDEERGTVNQTVQGRFKGVGSSAPKERSTGNESLYSVTIPEQKRMATASAVERGVGIEMAQNLVSTEQRRLDGMDRSLHKDARKKIEGKEKAKDQEIDGKRREKHKDKDQDKKHKGKNKIRNKVVEKEEKTREKEQHKHKEQDKPRDIGKKEQVAPQSALKDNVKSLALKDNVKSLVTDGCLKRKESNGFLHENELRPSKLPRPSSSHLSLENGNQLDQRHSGNLCAADSRDAVAVNIIKLEKILDRKEHKINGVIDIHPPSTVLQPPLIADATENGETSKMSPHPDEKHLSQILQVPKMEEWPEFDDQEWLLNRDDLRQKPKKTRVEADEAPKVWAEAVRIESADVLALPYVIPY